jgi:hypothetical protein
VKLAAFCTVMSFKLVGFSAVSLGMDIPQTVYKLWEQDAVLGGFAVGALPCVSSRLKDQLADTMVKCNSCSL